MTPSENSTHPKEPSAAPAPVPTVELVAWSCQTNRNILLCHRPEETPGPSLRVRVRDNANFTRGMSVPARHISEDYYECAAPAMPRTRGKW